MGIIGKEYQWYWSQKKGGVEGFPGRVMFGFCWLNTNSIYTRVATDSFNDCRDPFPLLANYAQAIPSFPVQVFEL